MQLKDSKFLVVGAGFFGAVIAEQIANKLNQKVTVIDKRNHIGGNCYSEIDSETNIEYHKYGTHIFHTSNPTVWKYINKFTTFNSYYHQVLTTYKDKVYQMPINLETINSFYNVNLKPFEVDGFLEKERKKEYFNEPENFEEQAINFVGRPLYEAFLKEYTIKQWGKQPTEISASVIKRLPFRKNYNETYFFDVWQGIPTNGYTAIFDKLLASDNIELKLNVDYFDIKDNIPEDVTVIYTGEIDRLFDYKYGDLEYRTLTFEKEILNVEDYQGTSVMNYAELDVPYTRIHEPKHLHVERDEFTKKKTLIIKEYSKADYRNEPYYPLGGEKNQKIYNQYLSELKLLKNMIIGGRLADYKYYDMHHTIERALQVFKEQIKNKQAN